jgi:hypothetical protein
MDEEVKFAASRMAGDVAFSELAEIRSQHLSSGRSLVLRAEEANNHSADLRRLHEKSRRLIDCIRSTCTGAAAESYQSRCNYLYALRLGFANSESMHSLR